MATHTKLLAPFSMSWQNMESGNRVSAPRNLEYVKHIYRGNPPFIQPRPGDLHF